MRLQPSLYRKIKEISLMQHPSSPSSRQSCSRSRGFTLIELLIVVAIIAILAAIAIPNFLEAQTRAKVSRAKSDMRSVATALESYYVDENHYPPAYHAPNSTINPRIRRLVRLTTPIAYMTSVPIDAFNREVLAGGDSQLVRAFLYTDRASYARFVASPFASPYNGANFYRILWGEQFPSSDWLLRSRGPMGTGESGFSALGTSVDKRDVYDPSNGTVSVGNIFLLGGAGFLN